MNTETQKTGEVKTKCGFVAIIGAPNAGKSTLMNTLIGAKVAIVTHKVQTTRARMLGIKMVSNEAADDKTASQSQLVFIDTPGLFEPRRNLDRAMVSAAWSALFEADITLLMIDSKRAITDAVGGVLQQLKESQERRDKSKPLILVLNKIDCVERSTLLDLAQKLGEMIAFDAVFMISAKNGDGTEKLLNFLAKRVPESPLLYPENQISDVPLRLLCAEITREKLMLRLHQEIPYNLTAETTDWRELKDGSVRIEQMIYVAREGHKGMVVGKGGQTIKAISTEARADMATVLGNPVHLFLQVKARPNWQAEPARYTELGLNFIKGDGAGGG